MNKNFQTKLINGTIVGALSSLAWISKYLAPALASREARVHGIKIDKNKAIVTWDQKKTLIDTYTPSGSIPEAGWPVALLVHGGGFRFFSKESHALVAVQLAKLGYLIFTCDYRLAPKFPYPQGLTDVLSVYDWINHEMASLRGNPKRVLVVGESAGANFALAVCLLASGVATMPDRIPAPTSKLDWIVPEKAVLHCGYHQVSGTERFEQNQFLSKIVQSRVQMLQKNYLPESVGYSEAADWGLADPLCVLESLLKSGEAMSGVFPKVFIPVGGSDPVLDDSVRLDRVLQGLRLSSRLKVYPKAPHSFYAMPWNDQYEECWNDIREFLN